MTGLEPRAVEVAPQRTIPVFYRMLLHGQLTRGRMVGLVLLAGMLVLIAILVRSEADAEEGALFAIGEYGLVLFVPLAALMLANPMFGNLVEDRLLLYLWLKPTPRWHLAVAAFAAVATVLIGVTAAPMVAAALIAGFPSLAVPAALATVLGVCAYAAVYLLLGLRFSWGLWLGLAYLVVWENVFARLGDGPARFSLRSYLLTVLENGTERRIELADRSAVASVVVPLAVALAATALTAWVFGRRDVD